MNARQVEGGRFDSTRSGTYNRGGPFGSTMTRATRATRAMQLLVSVTCADEAIAALVGGAHVIDAKDPAAGALGAVRPHVFSEIRSAVGDETIVSAAIGDASDGDVEQRAAQLAARGATFVKIGFAGVDDVSRVTAALDRVVRACARANEQCAVVAVAYVDASQVGAVDPRALIPIAASVGARGVLVDTADKRGAGLTTLWTTTQLADWVAEVHEHRLTAAVAGKLALDDVDIVRESGADIIGVRGAACVGGRLGRVSVSHVQQLAARVMRLPATRLAPQQGAEQLEVVAGD